MQHGSQDLNELPRLFVDAFPSWHDLHQDCVIRLGIEVNQPDMSDEVAIVTQFGGRADLMARMQVTHPAKANHRDEFDRHLWNIITEGVAFAWATESLAVPPAFTDDDGKPDLVASDGTWVEVKSVWESDDERAAMNRMAEASERGTILVRMTSSFHEAHPVFFKKFEDGLNDALAKRRRQGDGRLVVYFALTGIDFGTDQDEAVHSLVEWASAASTRNDCGIVVTRRDAWREPLVQVGI